MPHTYTAQPLLPRRFPLAEGPLYHQGKNALFFVDITTGAFFWYDIEKGTLTETQLGQYLGAAIPTTGGRVLAAMTTGVYLYDEKAGLRPVCRPPQLTANLRLNDAKCDAAGRFWFGTIRLFKSVPEDGSLFCMEPDGTCRRVLEGISTSNGMDWSPDGKTMYYIDTPTNGVDAFDYDVATGAMQNRRRLATLPHPDGMTVDAEGFLWVALWGGDKVVRCRPDTGEVVAEVPLPANHVTSCCFGGPQLDTLYITSSGQGFDEAGHGRLYHLMPGVTGKPAHLFNDSLLAGGA